MAECTQAGKCPEGTNKVIFEEWVADPTSPERNDPDEVCTKRNEKIYRRGLGPQPPAHYGCKCKRVFHHCECRKRVIR